MQGPLGPGWNPRLGLTRGPSKAALTVGGRCCCRQGPSGPALLTGAGPRFSAACPRGDGCGSLAQDADLTSGRSGSDFAESGGPGLHWRVGGWRSCPRSSRGPAGGAPGGGGRSELQPASWCGAGLGSSCEVLRGGHPSSPPVPAGSELAPVIAFVVSGACAERRTGERACVPLAGSC